MNEKSFPPDPLLALPVRHAAFPFSPVETGPSVQRSQATLRPLGEDAGARGGLARPHQALPLKPYTGGDGLIRGCDEHRPPQTLL